MERDHRQSSFTFNRESLYWRSRGRKDNSFTRGIGYFSFLVWVMLLLIRGALSIKDLSERHEGFPSASHSPLLHLPAEKAPIPRSRGCWEVFQLVPPVCGRQCHILCSSVLGRWHRDWRCHQAEQTGEESQLYHGDDTGQCGGGDGEEDERKATSYNGQVLSLFLFQAVATREH